MGRTSGLSPGTDPRAIADADSSSRLNRVLTISLVVAALVQFALFATVLDRTMILEPVADMLVQMYQQCRDVSRVALPTPVLWEATGARGGAPVGQSQTGDD